MSLLGRFGWFLENGGKQVHPPRELRPSIRGLFDLHGNQFEWTHDWYADFAKTAAVDSIGAEGGSDRVYRGGGYFYAAAYCRPAYRSPGAPLLRSIYIGFRLALSPSRVSLEVGKGAEPSGVGTEGARR